MRISDWSSDVCSSDLRHRLHQFGGMGLGAGNTDRLQAVFFVDRIGDPTAFGGPPVDGLIGEFDAFGLANGANWQGRRRAGDISANGDRKSTRLNSSH